MTPRVEPLGEMFTPEEKKILRGRDPEHKRAKDALIVRLADAFTFRRAPRGWHPPFDCFKKAGLIERVDLSRSGLPAMSQDDFARANEYDPLLHLVNWWLIISCNRVMEHVRRRMLQCTSSISSGMAAEELKEILRTSHDVWVKDGKADNPTTIIRMIPDYTRISKVVCIGLSEIAIRLDPGSRNTIVIPRCLAQHLAVMSMVRYLRSAVSHEVQLFAADWSYDAAHQEALSSSGFILLDASYTKQEHFVAIDDNTMFISFSIADFESILPIVSEYSRPVAMLYDAYDYLVEEGRPRPFPSPVWSQVKYNDAWVTIPGPPLVTTRASRESEKGSPSTPVLRWLPFYTDSTGRMLDDYEITLNMFEFDMMGRANRFGCQVGKEQQGQRAVDGVGQKRFVSKYSRLFVRKW